MEITFFIPLVPLFVASMHFLFFSRTEWRRRRVHERERASGLGPFLPFALTKLDCRRRRRRRKRRRWRAETRAGRAGEEKEEDEERGSAFAPKERHLGIGLDLRSCCYAKYESDLRYGSRMARKYQDMFYISTLFYGMLRFL